MTPDEVAEHAESLPRRKRKGTEQRPAWYVDDRLVALDHGNDDAVRAAITAAYEYQRAAGG